MDAILGLAVIFKHGDHLVDNFFRSMATALRFLDLLRIAATLNNEVVDVQHLGGIESQ